ncbi:MAG: hypothetical protein LUE93_11020 [Bacteroides sp.]|nr:hypothetical protein [Bacteroides sp.]
MAKYKLLLCILAGFLLLIPCVHAEEPLLSVAEGNIDLQNDTVKSGRDLLRIRPVGRYDRGIANYRFIPKGKWIFGASFSHAGYDTNDSQFFSFLENFSFNGKVTKLDPFIGYSVRDNIVVGIKLGYEHMGADLDQLNITIDDVEINMQDLHFTEDLYTATLFHRSYVGLDAGKRFGLFNETNLTYSTGDTRFTRGNTNVEEIEDVATHINQIRLGINPGVSVFIMENVSVECSFGVAGFKYRNEKQKTNQENSGSRKTSGVNFKINLFNINLGITICM